MSSNLNTTDEMKQVDATTCISFSKESDMFVENTSNLTKNIFYLNAQSPSQADMGLTVGDVEVEEISELNSSFAVRPLIISWNGPHSKADEEKFLEEIGRYRTVYGDHLDYQYISNASSLKEYVYRMYHQIAAKRNGSSVEYLLKLYLSSTYVIKTIFNDIARYHQCDFWVTEVLEDRKLIECLDTYGIWDGTPTDLYVNETKNQFLLEYPNCMDVCTLVKPTLQEDLFLELNEEETTYFDLYQKVFSSTDCAGYEYTVQPLSIVWNGPHSEVDEIAFIEKLKQTVLFSTDGSETLEKCLDEVYRHFEQSEKGFDDFNNVLEVSFIIKTDFNGKVSYYCGLYENDIDLLKDKCLLESEHVF